MKTTLRAMNALLRGRDDETRSAGSLLIGATACIAIYAAAAGFFQGGFSVVLAAIKIPLIIFGSVILCLPSLYIFTALAGAEISFRDFSMSVAAFCGIIGLILLALMPVAWLFAVSTMSLTFVVWLHIFVWLTALLFAERVLGRKAPGARSAVALWVTLLFLVSLQMTTYLRPVLWQPADGGFFQLEKESFLAHLGQVIDFEPAPPPPIPRGLKPHARAATLEQPPASAGEHQSR